LDTSLVNSEGADEDYVAFCDGLEGFGRKLVALGAEPRLSSRDTMPRFSEALSEIGDPFVVLRRADARPDLSLPWWAEKNAEKFVVLSSEQCDFSVVGGSHSLETVNVEQTYCSPCAVPAEEQPAPDFEIHDVASLQLPPSRDMSLKPKMQELVLAWLSRVRQELSRQRPETSHQVATNPIEEFLEEWKGGGADALREALGVRDPAEPEVREALDALDRVVTSTERFRHEAVILSTLHQCQTQLEQQFQSLRMCLRKQQLEHFVDGLPRLRIERWAEVRP